MQHDPPARPNRLGRWGVLILLAAGAAIGGYFLRDTVSLEALRSQQAALAAFRDAHPFAMPALFIATYVAIVAFSLPGALIASLTGGFVFGLFPGVIYNVTGATLGAVVIFWAVRTGLGKGWRNWLDTQGGGVQRLRDGLRDNEVPVLLAMRLVPVVPFFAANLVPAFMGVGLWRFAWTTLIGIFPGALVYTWVGAGLGEVFARGESPRLGLIFEPQVLGPLIALALLALAPVIWKFVRRR